MTPKADFNDVKVSLGFVPLMGDWRIGGFLISRPVRAKFILDRFSIFCLSLPWKYRLP